ncbi:Uncharacterised protein [Mycobacteroides abscessus subsp. abscessus]|nr:Uncharacterised protein [Mycobacteroides abscessus subsp. abscessus]
MLATGSSTHSRSSAREPRDRVIYVKGLTTAAGVTVATAKGWSHPGESNP